uniref:Uncharacterized protein n=1 Tax=Dulem virus 30 TaxID=3145748 RepID=A0AAU8B668_9CAUD
MNLIKTLKRKVQQLKEMITDKKGYRYNKALYAITDGMALAQKNGNTELMKEFVTEFKVLKTLGFKAWKSYKKEMIKER